MKTITLTQGKVALVDDEDFERVSRFKWFAWKHGKTYYAKRTIARSGRWRSVFMHRYILRLNGKVKTDHRNGNGLDNRRNNLRRATSAQNARNRQSFSRSNFKGVHRVDFLKTHPWKASIRIGGRLKHIGVFASPVEAARAYNARAVREFGTFAWLNPV